MQRATQNRKHRFDLIIALIVSKEELSKTFYLFSHLIILEYKFFDKSLFFLYIFCLIHFKLSNYY